MNKNFGQMKSSLSTWAREPIDDDIARDSLNDGIETIWSKVVEAQIAQFVGGPVQISFAAASERTQLVSIPDPTVAPVVIDAVGGALPQRTPVVAYTILTESGSETMLSPTTAHLTAVNKVCQVAAPARVPQAFGWNLYAGSSVANLCRQNAAPLPFGLPYTEDVGGFIDAGGEDAPGPLPPTENTTSDDVFYIKRLETPLQEGGFKSWEQITIDSSMFSWASRTIASCSEYQAYYYDLVNGRTLEYRPALGIDFPTARYFFVHRPRRISFDSATIPFYSFPWEEALRSYALAAWKGTQDEWDAHDRWMGRGDTALMRTTTLLRQQDWNKNIRIIPFIADSGDWGG